MSFLNIILPIYIIRLILISKKTHVHLFEEKPQLKLPNRNVTIAEHRIKDDVTRRDRGVDKVRFRADKARLPRVRGARDDEPKVGLPVLQEAPAQEDVRRAVQVLYRLLRGEYDAAEESAGAQRALRQDELLLQVAAVVVERRAGLDKGVEEACGLEDYLPRLHTAQGDGVYAVPADKLSAELF